MRVLPWGYIRASIPDNLMSTATGLNMALSMLLLQIAFGKCSEKYQIYSYILSLEGTDRNLHVHTKQHYVVYYWQIIWASRMII